MQQYSESRQEFERARRSERAWLPLWRQSEQGGQRSRSLGGEA